MLLKFISRNRPEPYKITRLNKKWVFPPRIEKLQGGPADVLPTPRTVNGINARLPIGYSNASSRDLFARLTFARGTEPFVKPPQIGESRSKPDHVDLIQRSAVKTYDLIGTEAMKSGDLFQVRTELTPVADRDLLYRGSLLDLPLHRRQLLLDNPNQPLE